MTDLSGKRANRIAIVGLVALLCFAFLGPFMSFGPLAAGGDSNLLRQVVNLVTFSLALSAANAWHQPTRTLVIPYSILIAIAWFALSIAWALEPGIASRRLGLTIIVTWSAFLLQRELGYAGTLSVIRTVLPIVLFINYISILVLPNWSIHGASESDVSIVGAWRGVLMHKNLAAPVCALTIMFHLFDSGNVRRIGKYLILIAAGYFLWRTESKTSIVVLVMSLTLGWLYRFYSPAYRLIVLHLLALASLLALWWLTVQWEHLLAVVENPEAFTGRGAIWNALIQYSIDHWALGSGFGSFWNIGSETPVAQYTAGWVSKIASGHNGYLDLAVQVGLPGLGLALIAVLVVPLFTFLMGTVPRRKGGLLFSCISFCLGHNFTESSLFDRDAAVYVFLMLLLSMLYEDDWMRRVRRPADAGSCIAPAAA